MAIEKISNTDEDKALIEGSEEGAMIIVLIDKINEIVDWINAQ
jgi:hypothetical protein